MSFTPITLFTDWFKENAFFTIGTPAPVEAVFFTRTPELGGYADPFAAMTGLGDITSLAEWVPLTIPMTSTEDLFVDYVSISVDWGGLRIVNGSSEVSYLENGVGWVFPPQDSTVFVQEQISAVVFYLPGLYYSIQDPIMFATTQGIGDRTVAHAASIFGQTQENLGSLSPGWLVAVDVVTFNTDFFPGAVLLDPEEPDWESAHAQHLWLEPQRTNLIANPSFEGWSPDYPPSIPPPPVPPPPPPPEGPHITTFLVDKSLEYYYDSQGPGGINGPVPPSPTHINTQTAVNLAVDSGSVYTLMTVISRDDGVVPSFPTVSHPDIDAWDILESVTYSAAPYAYRTDLWVSHSSTPTPGSPHASPLWTITPGEGFNSHHRIMFVVMKSSASTTKTHGLDWVLRSDSGVATVDPTLLVVSDWWLNKGNDVLLGSGSVGRVPGIYQVNPTAGFGSSSGEIFDWRDLNGSSPPHADYLQHDLTITFNYLRGFGFNDAVVSQPLRPVSITAFSPGPVGWTAVELTAIP